MNISSYFYHDKPLFGLDVGFSSIKVMQMEWTNKKANVIGYGYNRFDANLVKDGVITDIEALAKCGFELFDKQVIGEIDTRRVAITIPGTRTFNRIIKLPKMSNKELAEAVHAEAEQYIPVAIDELYLDYEIINRTADELELLAVAVPKKIVDSYVLFARMLGLEVVAIETSLSAESRLFVHTDLSDVPTVLMDFGSVSTDITIYDNHIIVTGTVPGGGDDFTKSIATKLGIGQTEANIVKTKYGLSFSKKQKEITEALAPGLDSLLKEIRRMIRYYEERYGKERKISQVVTMGGGANMPGLSDFMTNSLRLPVRMSDPWSHLGFSHLQPPSNVERSMYVTVAGLALINPKEIFS